MNATDEALKTLPALDLEFPTGLPGLESARYFHLAPLGEDLNVFGQLTSLEPVILTDEPDVAHEISIIVAAPGLLWPEYDVEVDDEYLEVIELADVADAIALVIVQVGEDLEHSTANLFAPIVVNVARRKAVQVVPRKSPAEVPWQIASPLPALLQP